MTSTRGGSLAAGSSGLLKAGPKPPDVMDHPHHDRDGAPPAAADPASQLRLLQRTLERQHRLYDKMLNELKATQRALLKEVGPDVSLTKLLQAQGIV